MAYLQPKQALMEVGQYWAWRETNSAPLKRVRLLSVDDPVHVRAELADTRGVRQVDDIAVHFWCPWDELETHLLMRREAGERLEAARRGEQWQAPKPPADDPTPRVSVRPPGIVTERMAYSLEAAAEECGVSTTFLRGFINRNRLVAHYANGKLIILAEDLRAWSISLPEERR